MAALLDNILYLMKGCMLKNLVWGSYHQEEEIAKFNPDKYDIKPAVKAYSFGEK